MSKTIGCIGFGAIGSALLLGWAGRLSEKDWTLCAYNRTPEKLKDCQGIRPMPSIAELAKASDLIILAVKPGQMEEVVNACAPFVGSGKIVCSVAAGIRMAWLRLRLGQDCVIARCIPTTTALTGNGVFALAFDGMNLTDAIEAELQALFETLGCCLKLPEQRLTDFSAYIGAGPAYIYAAMQGLAQAGLTLGFTREQNKKMLSELLLGCGELAKKSDKNFMDLRDDVCSPAGLTIAAMNRLDRAGLTGLLVEAVLAARERGLEMDRERQ